MRRFIRLLLVFVASSCAASACGMGPGKKSPAITNDNTLNLVAVTDLGSKGRAQDGNVKPPAIYQAIYKNPKTSVPRLIASLTDPRKTREPALCPVVAWTTVGDVAFMILTDMFVDSSWQKNTVPGTSTDDLIGRSDEAFLTHLHDYAKKHGRASLQRKWQRIWSDYKDGVDWDQQERCFVLRKADGEPQDRNPRKK